MFTHVLNIAKHLRSILYGEWEFGYIQCLARADCHAIAGGRKGCAANGSGHRMNSMPNGRYKEMRLLGVNIESGGLHKLDKDNVAWA